MAGYIMLTLGGLLFGAMVYRYDMHEREPWWMLVCAALAGGLLMAGAYVLEDLVQALLIDGGPQLSYRVTKSITAGTLEELAKLAVPVGVLLLVKKHFNDPMDGLVYGSMAGLGAALYESLWYTVFIHQPADAPLLHAQGPNALRLLMHTVWGGISGFALGLVVMKRPWKKPLAKCVGLVMLMHFTWDCFLGFVQPEQQSKLVAALIIAASIVWYGALVVKANKWSRSMHAPSSKQKLIGRVVRALVFRKFK